MVNLRPTETFNLVTLDGLSDKVSLLIKNFKEAFTIYIDPEEAADTN